jgi:hypothetical protein
MTRVVDHDEARAVVGVPDSKLTAVRGRARAPRGAVADAGSDALPLRTGAA